MPERAYRTWGEQSGELILLAMDETGWLSLVGLTNRGFLAGADRGRPRVDWHDLERFSDGVIALTGMPGGGGILSSAIEHARNPAEPIEAFGLARRLMELYPDRLYLELAFHGNAAEKLVNRGLVAIAQRMELPLVATGGVRFARPEDALAHKFLEAIGRGTRADGVLGHNGRDGYDLPTHHRRGGSRSGVSEIAEARCGGCSARCPPRCRPASRSPSAARSACRSRGRKLDRPSARQRLGPALLFGLEPAREMNQQHLAELVEQALPARFAATGRGVPSPRSLRAGDERKCGRSAPAGRRPGAVLA